MCDEILKNVFNYDSYKSEYQKAACIGVFEGKKDMVVSLPSQGGKSLCFQLAGALPNSGLTVVVDSSLASIKTNLETMTSFGILGATINSSVDYATRREIEIDLLENSSGIKVLFVTPEMLCEASFRPKFDSLCENGTVSRIFIDNAHTMFDEWREAFKDLKNLKKEKIPIIALANASVGTLQLIASNLRLDDPILIKHTCVRYDTVYNAVNGNSAEEIKDKILQSLNAIKVDNKLPSVLIYANSINDAIDLATFLTKNGAHAEPYFAEHSTREKVHEQWTEEKFKVLVATYSSFGFGAVKSPLMYVHYYKTPYRLEDYFQASGRARNVDGATVTSTIFYFSYNFKVSDRRPIDNYLLTDTCRRRFIGQFFGEEIPDCISKCDNCIRLVARQ